MKGYKQADTNESKQYGFISNKREKALHLLAFFPF